MLVVPAFMKLGQKNHRLHVIFSLYNETEAKQG